MKRFHLPGFGYIIGTLYECKGRIFIDALKDHMYYTNYIIHAKVLTDSIIDAKVLLHYT